MGSRKESLKKSLGISEYPWSSDDEEPANPQNHFDVHTHRGQTTEPLPSVSEMPGPSGQQTPSSPTLSPPRANASRLERDLYWTLVGNHRPSPVHDGTRRLCHAPPLPGYLSRGPVYYNPPSDSRGDRNGRDRPGGSNDIQRILAFKKLTRNLGLRQKSNCQLYAIPTTACVPRHRPCTRTRQNSPRSAPSTNGSHSSTSVHSSTGHSSTRSSRGTTATSSAYARPSKYSCNLHSMTSRAPPTRNPIFTPSVPPDAAAAAMSNRVNSVLKRLQTIRTVRGDRSRNAHTRAPHMPPPPQQALPAEQVAPPLPAVPLSAPVVAPPLSVVAPLTPFVAPPPSPAVAPLDLAREWGEWGDEPVVVDDPTAAEQSDDVAEVPENMEAVQPTDETDTSEVEAIDVELPSTAAVSLEEDIAELDAADGAEVSVPGAADGGGRSEAAAAPANEEAEALQQQSNESKRKREGDDAEQFTVREFNQSLLRLLECPVCLEWMEPPMSQCRRGHLVCVRCRARLSSCPVCRTTFSSVRNRAMEGVAEMVRYPCRHGCGREVRLRRRSTHEASCGARRYHCPAPPCAERPPLPRDHLHHHFQSKHMSMLKIGRKHKFSMKVNSEMHDTWLITALHEYFYLRVDVDIRTWGVIVYVAYIGPKCNANHYTYEVTVLGQHNSRKLVYARATHSDLESSSLNVSRQDCFHLTLDQALNFLRFKNRHCEPDKFLDFNIEISKCEREIKDDSDS